MPADVHNKKFFEYSALRLQLIKRKSASPLLIFLRKIIFLYLIQITITEIVQILQFSSKMHFQ